MSISNSSLKRCFWRAFMIENAIAMVSSWRSLFNSASGTRSPSMRMTGWLPTFKWRSDAFRSTAILSRSLMFIARAPTSSLTLHRGRRLDPDRRQPAAPIVRLAGDDPPESGHQAAGDLARAAGADRQAVDAADRRDLGRRAGEE